LQAQPAAASVADRLASPPQKMLLLEELASIDSNSSLALQKICPTPSVLRRRACKAGFGVVVMQVVQNCSCGVDLHFSDGCMGWRFTIIEFWGTHGDKDTANAIVEFLTGINAERHVSRACSYSGSGNCLKN